MMGMQQPWPTAAPTHSVLSPPAVPVPCMQPLSPESNPACELSPRSAPGNDDTRRCELALSLLCSRFRPRGPLSCCIALYSPYVPLVRLAPASHGEHCHKPWWHYEVYTSLCRVWVLGSPLSYPGLRTLALPFLTPILFLFAVCPLRARPRAQTLTTSPLRGCILRTSSTCGKVTPRRAWRLLRRALSGEPRRTRPRRRGETFSSLVSRSSRCVSTAYFLVGPLLLALGAIQCEWIALERIFAFCAAPQTLS